MWREEIRGKVEEKNGEAKPSRFSAGMEAVSGRPLEVQTQFLGVLVRAHLPISAMAGLYGTRCGMWLTLAKLTDAV